VTNTVSSFTMPLGDGFVDAFTRAVAEDDVSQATPITFCAGRQRKPARPVECHKEALARDAHSSDDPIGALSCTVADSRL
jgi:hypothetical protein